MIDASNQECDLPEGIQHQVFIEVFKHLGQQLLDCRIVPRSMKSHPYIWINQIPFGLERMTRLLMRSSSYTTLRNPSFFFCLRITPERAPYAR